MLFLNLPRMITQISGGQPTRMNDAPGEPQPAALFPTMQPPPLQRQDAFTYPGGYDNTRRLTQTLRNKMKVKTMFCSGSF